MGAIVLERNRKALRDRVALAIFHFAPQLGDEATREVCYLVQFTDVFDLRQQHPEPADVIFEGLASVLTQLVQLVTQPTLIVPWHKLLRE